MFIYSIKANTLKLFGIIGVLVVAVILLVIFVPSGGAATTGAIAAANEGINFDKIKTPEDIVKFLEQFGWTVEGEPLEAVEVTIPSEFDRVMTSYNELQKHQGLDLSKHQGRDVMRYTYKVTNYPDYDGTVYANVIVYKNRVIGGDICSSDVNGFINGFAPPSDAS